MYKLREREKERKRDRERERVNIYIDLAALDDFLVSICIHIVKHFPFLLTTVSYL